MNRVHRLLCRSGWWHRIVADRLLPWALRGVELGDHVLEIGPGFGATTRVLARGRQALTVVEIDPALAGRLRDTLPRTVTVVEGDGTSTMVTVDPGRLPARLRDAGFATADTTTVNRTLRFRALKPGAPHA
jgi:hypothetical protein